MKVFVINLKRSPHRAAHMKQQLDSLSLPYELFAATDGLTLTEDTILNLTNMKSANKVIGRNLTANEVGCADSHLRIYEKMVKDNIQYALILEDDVNIDSRLSKVLQENFLKQKQFDWLQIDYYRAGLPLLNRWWSGLQNEFRKSPLSLFYSIIKLPYLLLLIVYEYTQDWFNQNNPRIVYRARPLYLASAYIITKEGAQKLLKINRPIQYVADMVQNKARLKKDFKLLAVSPALVQQNWDVFESDIGHRDN